MNGDGYIQSKQRELHELLTSTEQKANLLEKRIEAVNKTIENYEQLITMLKKQEEFNKDLQSNNAKIIEQMTEGYHKKMNDVVETILRKKGKELDKEMNLIGDTVIETFRKQKVDFRRIDNTVGSNNFFVYLLCHELQKKKILGYDNLKNMRLLQMKFSKLSDGRVNVKEKGEIKKFLKEVFGDFIAIDVTGEKYEINK